MARCRFLGNLQAGQAGKIPALIVAGFSVVEDFLA
jgi:hypothetical protein